MINTREDEYLSDTHLEASDPKNLINSSWLVPATVHAIGGKKSFVFSETRSGLELGFPSTLLPPPFG